MSAHAGRGPDGLPEAAVRVLERYREEAPEREIRVWAETGDGPRLVYPAGGEDGPRGGGGARGAGVDVLPAAVRGAGAEAAEPAVVEAGRRSGEPAVAEPPGELHDLGGGLSLSVTGSGDDEDGAIGALLEAVRAVLAYDREAMSAARELAERYEEINLLYSISEILGSVLSLEAASERILTEVAEVMGARRASLWVHDTEQDVLRLAAAVGDGGLGGPIRVDDPTSVTAAVFRNRELLNLERGSLPPAGTRLEPRPHGSEPFLSVPINYTPPEGATRTVGVVTLLGHRTDVRFSAGDARLLSAIASQVGAAVETQRLVAQSLSRERMVRELELAHDLQLKLLPPPAGFEPLAEVAARCAPADSVGGDFYHLFRLESDRVGVVIGDVSGHGFSAALIMALTLSAVAIYAREAGEPAEVLGRLHGALIDELESTEMHLTLFYAVVRPAGGELVYASAGHPHAFRVREDGSAERLAATSPPLGTIPVAPGSERRLDWKPGSDLLCVFTDGLSDAFDARRGDGEGKLVAEVGRLRDRPVSEILDRLFAAAEDEPLAIPPDDRTAVLVR